jgi:atrial natriuretic peptide receptor A
VVLGSFFLGLLTASTLVERQLHRNLLYKMMPRRAIAKLRRGQTVLEKFNLVTIFFSDIVGFTSMAGNMRPIQVMKMLNELYTELDKLVKKHQVYKVETIGDAYMVVGGAPDRVPAPLAAERVALFAIDAIELVETFRTKDGDRLFIRAGLASGPAVAGVVGQAMPRYCFFGDTVNFASRMESTSKKMRIQCAYITYRLLQDSPNMHFNLVKRVEGDIVGVDIKGKGHQVT